MPFNPWPSMRPTRGTASQKKIARLAGTEEGSGKVHVLIKLHDWAGRAIYLYNLLTEEEMIHIPRPTPEEWAQYSKIGVQIIHPGGIPADNAPEWIKYGRQEAQRRGLIIAE
jgi:hypothetical protein